MSILSKIKLDEDTALEFSMQILGTTERSSDVRLVIEGKDYDVVCHGTIESDSVKFKLPKLRGVLDSGVYECKMEVIIDGKIFTPLTESVEFLPLIELEIAKTKVEAIKEGRVEIAFKKEPLTKIQEAAEEGYTITKWKDYNLLRKEGLYYGIVSDSKKILADRPSLTVEDLIESLSLQVP